MPYPRPFVHLVAEGHFGATSTSVVDIWRCTFNFATNSGTTYSPASLLSFATTAASAFSTFHAATALKAGSACFLDSVSAATIGTDGLYVGGGAQATQRYTLTTPLAGNGSSSTPWSQAICFTTRTAILRGPGHAGRWYWPATGLGVGATTGILAQATQDSLVTIGVALVQGLNQAANSAFGSGHAMTVMSKIGAGVAAPVVRIEVGARVDSQERRESKIPEAYRGAPVPGVTRAVDERDELVTRLIKEAIGDDLDDVN